MALNRSQLQRAEISWMIAMVTWQNFKWRWAVGTLLSADIAPWQFGEKVAVSQELCRDKHALFSSWVRLRGKEQCLWTYHSNFKKNCHHVSVSISQCAYTLSDCKCLTRQVESKSSHLGMLFSAVVAEEVNVAQEVAETYHQNGLLPGYCMLGWCFFPFCSLMQRARLKLIIKEDEAAGG